MSILIKKSKLLLFFIFLFLSFLFLFNISGMSKNQQTRGIISHHLEWMQSLNKYIPALANRYNSLSVRPSFQQGNLLAVKLSGNQDYQGNEREIEKIVAIDLSTRKILYEKVLYDTKTFIGLYENYLIYSYNENDKKSADDYANYKLKIIDLTNENREKESKGTLHQISENGYIMCRYPGHLIDIKNGEIVFSHEYLKGSSPLLTTSGFFMKTKNEKGNWGGYQFINYQGEVVFSLPDISPVPIYLPRNKKNSTLSFPIPILNEGDNEENLIQFIDDSGEVVDTYPLSEMGISGTAFGQNHLPYGHLEILAKYKQKYILEVEVSTEEEKGKEYILWFDGQKKKVSILEEDIRVMTEFTPDGNLISLAEGEGGYGHFTLKYYDPQGNCLWEKYLPPDIDGFVWFYPINEESVLLYDNHKSFFRYSLIDGQLTGLYPFPIDYNVQLATLFDDQAYVLIGQMHGQGYNDTELAGNHLVSFPLENTGWFDFELVKVSPLAGQPLTVYEDRKIDLEFQSGHYVLAEEQLEINFDKGEVLNKTVRYSERWDCQWQSPELIGKDKETVNITASYGPISKNYQVVVKNLENPLILTGELKVNSRDQYQLILEGNIKNTAHLDIEDLDWQWELDNLNEIHSSFPNNIPAQREKPFSMRFDRLAISEDQWEKIDWDGYEILQEVKLSCNYPEGSCEQVFSHLLQIEPTYSISLRLFDPVSQHYWEKKDLEKLDLSKFSIWDDQNNNITANFLIKENLSKKRITIQNIAPGITEKPTKLEVRYPGSSKWLELYFQQEKHPKFPKIAEDSFQFNLPFAPGILVKITDQYTQQPIKDVTVYLRKKNEDDDIEEIAEKQTDKEGKCDFSDIEPGNYLIETSKEGFIACNLQIPSGGYIETYYSVQLAEQKEINLTMVPYVGVLFKAESYYDSFYKDVTKKELLKSVGMNTASDHVFILPENASYLFFNLLYKVGYPEDAAIFGWFTEDHYKVALEIEDEDGALVNKIKVSRGKKIITFTEGDIYIRGDQSNQDFGEIYYNAGSITKPTPFTFKLKTQDNDWKSSTLWIFPYEWKDYEKEALQVSLLYPLKNKLDTFDYAIEARDFLKEEGSQVDLMAALSPVIDYGVRALKIFGEFPDESFKENIKNSAKDFLRGKIKGALENALGVTRVTIISEVLDIVLMVINAIDWGDEFADVVKEGEAEAYSTNCIENLADSANLQNSKRLLEVIKDNLPQLFMAAETNQPLECRTLIGKLRTIIVGNHPDGENAYDYVIDYGQFGISPVANSTGYALIFHLCLELGNIVDVWSKNYAPYFDEFILKNTSNSALKLASQKAMLVYKPIIKNLIQIISIPLNVVLLELE